MDNAWNHSKGLWLKFPSCVVTYDRVSLLTHSMKKQLQQSNQEIGIFQEMNEMKSLVGRIDG